MKITKENKLILSFGYLINLNIQPGDDFCGILPERLSVSSPVRGYYGGFLSNPGGVFRDLDNLASVCAEAAKASRLLSVPVDMNFEGLVKTRCMTVLVQPIRGNHGDYKSVDELVRKYLK